MAYYVSDQNTVAMIYSSGTYAIPSGTAATGQWIGLVQSHSVDEDLTVKDVRFTGTATRNVDKFVDGVINVTGDLSYIAQDFRMLQFALGSVYDGGSPSIYTHSISELNSNSANAYTSGTTNPFIDFNIEDIQKSSNKVTKKTVKGAQVDTFDISWAEDDFVTCDISYIAQQVNPASGTAFVAAEDSTIPYMSHMVQVQIPSGNTLLQGVKEGTISINNNLVPQHRGTGSKEIQFSVPTNRDYEVTLSLDKDSATINDNLYQKYFQSGAAVTEFNMIIDINDRSAGVGSRDIQFIFSGCRIPTYASPTNAGVEVVPEDITIRPTSMIAIENNSTQYYRAWSGP